MKSIYNILAGAVLCATILGCDKSDDSGEVDTSPVIQFSDTIFKNALVNNMEINTNGDDEISENEAESFTGNISAPNRGVTSVVGIEYFVNATKISLFNNSIYSIDLSNNTKVTQVLLESNKLSTLDVSMLPDLVDLKVHSNKLDQLNVANGNNSNMTRMEVQNNIHGMCIQVDELPVPTSGWVKDKFASYTTDCNQSSLK